MNLISLDDYTTTIRDFKKQKLEESDSYFKANKYSFERNDNIINKTKKNFWAKINHKPGFPKLNQKVLNINTVSLKSLDHEKKKNKR